MDRIYCEKINLSIENISSFIKVILREINLKINNIDEDDIYDIKVILNELITNAVKYGNCFDANKIVFISVAVISNK